LRTTAEGRARRRDSWRVYRLQLALGAAGLAACGLVLAAGVHSVHVHAAGAHRVDVGGLRLTYPAVNAAAVLLLALAALGAAVLVVAARAAWWQGRAQRRMLRALPLAGALSNHPTVLVVDVAAPLAFCAGWLRPRVYVSAGVLDRLSDRELRAVLAHEQQHGTLRDPLRLAVSRVLCQALFFLPVLGSLHATYADAAELAADAAALDALDGATAPLASAMLAVAATESGVVTGISPQRVDALLGRPVAWKLPRLLVIAGLATIVVLVALVWRASAGASVQTSLNLPIASSQPCILVLAMVPVLAALAAALSRRPALATTRSPSNRA
jgi:Zn-dependent protease with chaperone function